MSGTEGRSHRLDPRRKRWLLWGILVFGYLLMSFSRVSTAVLSEALTQAFDTTATELGLLHSSFFYLYAALQLPAGLLADRYGPRHVAAAGTLVMGLGTAALGLSDTFAAGFLARALIGLGGSVIFLSILRFGVTWFRSDEYATLTGLTIGVSALGGVIATTPLAVAAATVGWRASMLGVGGLCIASAVTIYLFVRDRPGPGADVGSQANPTNPSSRSTRSGVRAVLSRGDTWAIGVMMFLVLGVNFTIVGLWAVPYLVDIYGTSVTAASAFVLAGNVGLLLGSPLFGWVADRTARRTSLMILATTAFTGVYVGIALVGTPPLLLVGAILFTSMFVNGGVALGFAVARERNRDDVSGTVSGTVNSVGYAGAAAMPAVMGVALDTYWTGTVVDGVRVYSLTGYRIAFGIAAVAGAIALVCALWLHYTR